MSLRTEIEPDQTRHAEPERLLLVPTVTVGTAARQHPLLVLLPVILLVGGALAAGYYARSPIYSAQTRLAVGRLDGSTPASLAGFAAATQALAEKYSREVRGDAIVDSVARKLSASPSAVRSHISAAPIPQTPVFRVIATAASPDRSIVLANAVSDELRAQAARESAATPDSARLLRAYRRANARLDARRARVDRAQKRWEERKTTTNRTRLGEARADAAATTLRVRGLAAEYAGSRHTQGTAAVVQVVEHATAASSDRYRVMQLLGFAGVVAGVAVGLGLALLRSRRLARRLVD
jgi:capsular polysaccharide biosynthesis protein